MFKDVHSGSPHEWAVLDKLFSYLFEARKKQNTKQFFMITGRIVQILASLSHGRLYSHIKNARVVKVLG